MKTNTTIRRAAVLTGLASCLFAAASASAASVPALPDPATDAVAAWTPQGQQLLIATLALLAAMILMERLCSWRLAVLQRRAVDGPTLREILPPAPELLPASLTADFQ